MDVIFGFCVCFFFFHNALSVKTRDSQCLLSNFKLSPVGKDACQETKTLPYYWNINLQRSEQFFLHIFLRYWLEACSLLFCPGPWHNKTIVIPLQDAQERSPLRWKWGETCPGWDTSPKINDVFSWSLRNTRKGRINQREMEVL